MKKTVTILLAFVALAKAVPVEDGGLDRYTKHRSFSKVMTDIDGDRHESSSFYDQAAVNEKPIYAVVADEDIDDDDDVKEAFDILLPGEDIHAHLDRLNGIETDAYEEPLVALAIDDNEGNEDNEEDESSLSNDYFEDEDESDEMPNYITDEDYPEEDEEEEDDDRQDWWY